MAVSPQAEIWRNTMKQTCTVYRYTGTDVTGQPQNAQGIEWPCRLAIRTERAIADTGDVITNSTVKIVVPADCPVQAYDQIDLPNPYQHGAVIREVITATDIFGQVTHKAVRIA